MEELFETEIGHYLKVSKPFIISNNPLNRYEVYQVEVCFPSFNRASIFYTSNVVTGTYFYFLNLFAIKRFAEVGIDKYFLLRIITICRKVFHKQNPFLVYTNGKS